jgi:phosphoribosylformylglycinamidine synthase
MKYRAAVTVSLKPTVLDAQGDTVRAGLHRLGYTGVESARVGKYIELLLVAADEAAARREAERMCADLLANPIIEDFTVRITPA